MAGKGYQTLIECRQRGRLLRRQGFTIDQVAIVLGLDYPFSPLRLYRYATGLTATQVVAAYAQRDPGRSTLRESRLYDYEAWPDSGRRPSIFALRLLAQIYQTHPARLVAPANIARYALRDRGALLEEAE
ncbi:hypothetical protein GCM10010160_38440 [Acrocarpospora corrugata]